MPPGWQPLHSPNSHIFACYDNFQGIAEYVVHFGEDPRQGGAAAAVAAAAGGPALAGLAFPGAAMLGALVAGMPALPPAAPSKPKASRRKK